MKTNVYKIYIDTSVGILEILTIEQLGGHKYGNL